MRHLNVGVAVAALTLLFGCGALPPPTPAAASPELPWLVQAREVSQAVPPRLLAVLQDEIARGGPEGAVQVCRDKAPELAREASAQTGWSIRRVSLRERNPKAVPDAWEREALVDFDRRNAAREPAVALERAAVVQENGQSVQRYIRALPTLDLCLNCHGGADRVSPAVQARLAALYPGDRAVGYRTGEIRGAITLRRTVAQR